MGRDRFVYWKDQKPTREEVITVLEDYLGGVGSIVDDKDRLFANLPGKGTHPLARIKDAKIPEDIHRVERWFEIYIDPEYIDIITRQHDQFTNYVADGFVEVMARWWNGRVET